MSTKQLGALPGTPTASAPGDTGSAGASADPPALSSHKHAREAAPAVGMANPMAAGGDLIVGGVATDWAYGTSAPTLNGGGTYQGALANVNDNNDATYWLGNTGVTGGQALTFDLGTAKSVGGVRLFQATGSYALNATAIVVAYSPDNSTWTSLASHPVSGLDDSWAFAAAVVARYWRLTATNTTGGTGWGRVQTICLIDSSTIGAPSRLPLTVPAANILEVIGVVNGETAPTYKAVHDATAPSTQAFGDAAVAGTALTAAHRDHKHAMPALESSAGGGSAGTKIWVGTTDPGGSASEGDIWVNI